MNLQPKNRNELLKTIEYIISNQLNKFDFTYGLKDIDVSLVDDFMHLFSCIETDKNSSLNILIDWNEPSNYIGDWDTSTVTDMNGMFLYSSFNQPIGNWNVSNVTDMSFMFRFSSFNNPLNSWNVSNVKNMAYMFSSTKFFDQDISSWDISSVTSMGYMFYDSHFNQDINSWNVSKVTSMISLFYNSRFDRTLWKWSKYLNKDVNLEKFNLNSRHEKKFGTISFISNFIENQLTPDKWIELYKQSKNDKERFELLKILKNFDNNFIKEVNKYNKNIII